MPQSAGRRHFVFTAAIAFVAFVSLGLPDGVLGVAWPFLRHTFDVPLSALGLVLLTGTGGYLVSSFLAGPAVARFGIGNVLLVSTALVAVALTCYAITPVFALVVASAFVVGLGSGAIDSAINLFSAERLPPSMVTWLHACYGIGATLGPLIMTAAIGVATWRAGYAVLAGMLAMMCVVFAVTRRAWAADPHHDAVDEKPASFREALGQPMVWLHAALFFVYCGIEVGTGQWLFSLLYEGRGTEKTLAGLSVTTFWAGLTAGRIIFGVVAVKVKPAPIVRAASIGIPLATLLLWANLHPIANLIAAGGIGFGCAPIYPLLMSLTPGRVGKRFAATAVGLQVSAATVGIAALPGTAGVTARWAGLETIPIFVLACGVALLVLHEVTMRVAAKSLAHAPAGFPVAAAPSPLPPGEG
jgi:fucose permease